MKFHSVFVIFLFWISTTNAYRILAMFPIPIYSHQIVAKKYIEELAKRGNEVVMITPLQFIYTNEINNLKVVNIPENLHLRTELFKAWSSQKKRGIIMDIENALLNNVSSILTAIESVPFGNVEVKKMISQKQKYDLIVVEAMTDYTLILGHIFDAPIIRLSSFYGFPDTLDSCGGVILHPIFYPNFNRNKFINLTFLDKIYQIYLELKIVFEFEYMKRENNRLLKLRFGQNAPTIGELQKRVALVMLNIHPIFDNNRPVPSSVVFLGGLHLEPVKSLPQDLKTYLDSSVNGTVYVSFGTNLDCSKIDDEFLDVFLKAFEALPYDVLWKCDRVLPRTPKNLKIGKWFPQRDLLAHEKIKAFVTQGGIQSTDEAIDSTVPMVGIPMLGDQWYNTAQYERLGIGIALDPHKFTHVDLISAVNNVIDDDKYKKNIQELRTLINDQPMTSMQRAVWWTEFVLRHEGRNQGPLGAHLNGVGESKQRSYGAYLKAATAGVTWAEWLMLDVVLIVLSAFFVSIILSIVVCYSLLRFVLSIFRRKFKVKKN